MQFLAYQGRIDISKGWPKGWAKREVSALLHQIHYFLRSSATRVRSSGAAVAAMDTCCGLLFGLSYCVLLISTMAVDQLRP